MTRGIIEFEYYISLTHLPLEPDKIFSYSDLLYQVWWVSQMAKYIMRPHASVASKLRQLKQQYRLGEYQNDEPVVGVHMRRTDKLIKEAGFFSIQEYMVHVSLPSMP